MPDALEATVTNCTAKLRDWLRHQPGGVATHDALMNYAVTLWPNLPAAVIRLAVLDAERQ